MSISSTRQTRHAAQQQESESVSRDSTNSGIESNSETNRQGSNHGTKGNADDSLMTNQGENTTMAEEESANDTHATGRTGASPSRRGRKSAASTAAATGSNSETATAKVKAKTNVDKLKSEEEEEEDVGDSNDDEPAEESRDAEDTTNGNGDSNGRRARNGRKSGNPERSQHRTSSSETSVKRPLDLLIAKEVRDHIKEEMTAIVEELRALCGDKMDLDMEVVELQEKQIIEDTYKGYQQVKDKYEAKKNFLTIRRDTIIERVELMDKWFELQTDNDVMSRYGEKRRRLLLDSLSAKKQLEYERDSLDEYLNTLDPLHDELNYRRVVDNAKNNAVSSAAVDLSRAHEFGRVILGLNSVNVNDSAYQFSKIEDQLKTESDRDIQQQLKIKKEENDDENNNNNNNNNKDDRESSQRAPSVSGESIATHNQHGDLPPAPGPGRKLKLSYYPAWIRDAVHENRIRSKLIEINTEQGTLGEYFEEDPYFRDSVNNRKYFTNRLQLPPLITGLAKQEVDDDIGLIHSLDPENREKYETESYELYQRQQREYEEQIQKYNEEMRIYREKEDEYHSRLESFDHAHPHHGPEMDEDNRIPYDQHQQYPHYSPPREGVPDEVYPGGQHPHPMDDHAYPGHHGHPDQGPYHHPQYHHPYDEGYRGEHPPGYPPRNNDNIDDLHDTESITDETSEYHGTRRTRKPPKRFERYDEMPNQGIESAGKQQDEQAVNDQIRRSSSSIDDGASLGPHNSHRGHPMDTDPIHGPPYPIHGYPPPHHGPMHIPPGPYRNEYHHPDPYYMDPHIPGPPAGYDHRGPPHPMGPPPYYPPHPYDAHHRPPYDDPYYDQDPHGPPPPHMMHPGPPGGMYEHGHPMYDYGPGGYPHGGFPPPGGYEYGMPMHMHDYPPPGMEMGHPEYRGEPYPYDRRMSGPPPQAPPPPRGDEQAE